MKKYILMLFAFVVAFTSCTNDDITISYATNFKINPATVVTSFYEATPGDLSTITGNYHLCVDLYVYNESGNLVASDRQQFSDYTHIMSSTQNLSVGNYTVVATTNVVGEVSYWKFEGEENLSTFTITDAGMIGGSHKILGLTIEHISVGSSVNDISIDVKPAGAVALIRCINWNKYTNVVAYSLQSNKACASLAIDHNGGVNYSVESKDNFSYYMSFWDYDSNYTRKSAYVFMFPMRDAKFSFFADTSSGNEVQLGATCIADIELGASYLFIYDVTENKNSWYDMTSTSSRSSDMMGSADKNVLFNNDIDRISFK